MIKRLNYIDNAKGLAILLMLFAHTMVNSNYLHTWIFSFHMPIFFIISGILFERKYQGNVDTKLLIIFLNKRAFQLGVPYFSFGILLAVFYTLLELLGNSPVQFSTYFFHLITLKGIDSLWFIPCFFLAELIIHVLFMIPKRAGKAVRLSLCLLIVGFLSTSFLYIDSIKQIQIVSVFFKAVVGYLFCYIGFLISKIRLLSKITIIIYVILFFVFSGLSLLNGEVAIGSLDFNCGLLFVVNATGISLSVLGILCGLEKINISLGFLSYFGKSSIVVLCTNNILIESIRLLDSKLTGNILFSWGMLGSVMLTGVLILLEWIIIRISEGKLGVLFGKRNEKKVID